MEKLYPGTNPWASMRPGHFAPDIFDPDKPYDARIPSFNEAGAFCPGY